MKYREVEKKLQALGCEEVPRRGGGSHRKWRNPVTGRATVVPDWRGKDLKRGTVRAVVRQLALEWREFEQA